MASAVAVNYIRIVKYNYYLSPAIYIYFIPLFLYLVEPALAEVYGFRKPLIHEVETLLFVSLWILSISIGFELSSAKIPSKQFNFDDNFINLMFALIVFSYIQYVLYVNGGFPKSILETRMFYIKISTSGVAFLFTILNVFLTILFIIKASQRHNIFSIAIFAFPLLLSGSKASIFNVLVLYLISMQFNSKLNLKFAFSILFLAIISMFYLLIVLHSIEGFAYSVWHYSDHFSNLNKLINKLYTEGFYNGEILFGSLIYLVPRLFWEGKPEVYGIHILSNDINPSKLADGIFTAFGPVGNGISDFGLLYMLIFSGIGAWIMGTLFYSGMRKKNILLIILSMYLNVVGLICISVLLVGNSIYRTIIK